MLRAPLSRVLLVQTEELDRRSERIKLSATALVAFVHCESTEIVELMSVKHKNTFKSKSNVYETFVI